MRFFFIPRPLFSPSEWDKRFNFYHGSSDTIANWKRILEYSNLSYFNYFLRLHRSARWNYHNIAGLGCIRAVPINRLLHSPSNLKHVQSGLWLLRFYWMVKNIIFSVHCSIERWKTFSRTISLHFFDANWKVLFPNSDEIWWGSISVANKHFYVVCLILTMWKFFFIQIEFMIHREKEKKKFGWSKKLGKEIFVLFFKSFHRILQSRKVSCGWKLDSKSFTSKIGNVSQIAI